MQIENLLCIGCSAVTSANNTAVHVDQDTGNGNQQIHGKPSWQPTGTRNAKSNDVCFGLSFDVETIMTRLGQRLWTLAWATYDLAPKVEFLSWPKHIDKTLHRAA